MWCSLGKGSPSIEDEKFEFLFNMARGRKRRTAVEGLRSRWWYGAIARAVACKHDLESPTPYGVSRVLLEEGVWSTVDSRQWYYYQKGERCPSQSVLNAVENAYPGTRRVFEQGPDLSFLWEALCGDARTALSQTEDQWRNGVRVEHVIRLPESIGLDDQSGQVIRRAPCDGIQDLVVPLELARRWGLPHGVRGNLNERLQPWERLKDLCGQLVDLPLQHQFALYAAAVLLSCAPSATATKEERLKAHPFIRLPYFAGLAYLIAKARVEGRKEIDVPEWDHGVLPVAAGNLCEKQPNDVRKAVDECAQMWEDFTRVSGIEFHSQSWISN